MNISIFILNSSGVRGLQPYSTAWIFITHSRGHGTDRHALPNVSYQTWSI